MNGRRWQVAVGAVVMGLVGAAVLVAAPASPAGAWAAGFPPPAPHAAVGADWTSYQHDVGHTGVDPLQAPARAVTPAWTSAALDGAVYAQPLVVGGRVLVATEGNTLYALNATDGGVAWQKSLGAPVPTTGFPCGDINPVGITATPVVDTSTNMLFAVALLAPTHHELFAVSLADGSIAWHRTVDAPGADPVVHNQRGALTLSGGQVFIPFGGRAGDCGNYQGRVVGAAENGTGPLATYTVPTAREGGIWTPAGPTVDSSGQLLVATGNSASTTAFDFGDSVIRLSPALSELDFFAPTNWPSLNSTDLDLGSTGPTLLADQGRIFQVGKDGVGYLLAANHLGGIGGQLFGAQVCPSGGGAFGGTAWQAGLVFVACNNGLVALSVAADGSSFSVAWRGPSGFAGPPIVSGGKVWTLYRSGTFYAFDESDGHIAFQATVSGFTHFAAPSSGSAHVFVAANGGITAYRLLSGTTAGDLDGDGRSDVAVFRPSTGVWYIQRSGGGTTIVNWGSPGDVAAPGDFDGDGRVDLAVFRPSTGTWYVQLSGGGTKVVNWGASGDVPVGQSPGS